MLTELLESAVQKIKACQSIKSLQECRVEFLGKSSLLQQEMGKMYTLSIEEKKHRGSQINEVRQNISSLIERQHEQLLELELSQKFEQEKLDLTLPHRRKISGSIHPITQCTEELMQVFTKYGFSIKYGPDIEDSWHNFDSLNIPETHPARQMQDSFYLKKGAHEESTKLLRTHTSPIQIRTMKAESPPYRFIAPGRVYRCDSDMTHTPMFHQIEGMVIDKNINMGHLKYTIIDFIKNFFEQSDIEIRFRPSFFPFTEPSAEVDIKIGKDSNWLEVLGCGMVHPNVLKNVGIDPEIYQGFAFGLGVDRFAMLKYGIKDLRQFFEGDLRWLQHYNFASIDIPSLAGGLTR